MVSQEEHTAVGFHILYNFGYPGLNIRGFLLQKFWGTVDKLRLP